MSDKITSIKAGALANGIWELVQSTTRDPRLAVAIVEAVMCTTVAHCVKPDGVSRWLDRFAARAPQLIAEIAAVSDEPETMQ